MALFIAVSQQTFVWILKINSLHFKIGASKKSIVFKHIFHLYVPIRGGPTFNLGHLWVQNILIPKFSHKDIKLFLVFEGIVRLKNENLL